MQGTSASRLIRRRVFVALTGASIVVGGLTVWPTPVHAAGTDVISGAMFQDANRNGVQDPGEAPFANVGLTLSDSGGNLVGTTATDSTGHYQFGGLADGTYTVEVASSTWASLRDSWVPTGFGAPAPGYLRFRVTVALTGAATANLPLRSIVRSTSMSAPLSTVTTPGGTVIDSYDDVVTAPQLASVLASAGLQGKEQPLTTIYFDYRGAPNDTTTTVSGSAGAYTGYSAAVWVQYDMWTTAFDELFFHEYGHAWSLYYAYIVQGGSLSGYLQARGLTGNPNLGTSHMWEPVEMIAEDFRQLFGSANAASYPQENYQVPPAAQVAGLKSWLQSTFTQSAFTQPAPTVTSVSPAAGPAAGGGTVTITGSNFTGSGWAVSGVFFGSTAATSFTVVSATQITAAAPPGSSQADITVRTGATNGGAVETSATSSADVYAWAAMPMVTGISPTGGPAKGGTAVTITGSGFTGPGFSVGQVRFGSAVASVTSISATQLTVVSPSGTVGKVAVTVTTPGGTSAASSATTFTYTKR